MMPRHEIVLTWRDPLSVASGLQGREGLLAMVAGGADPHAHGGCWSYVACEPDLTWHGRADNGQFAPLAQAEWQAAPVIGLASYDAGARAATGERGEVWPDLMLARYRSLLVFDHVTQTVAAYGYGEDSTHAANAASIAEGWWQSAVAPQVSPSAPSKDFQAERDEQAYVDAVADVIDRIGQGELFQANIARAWSGTLTDGRDPFEVLLRLSAHNGAAYGAYWALNGRAVVSNSPELFLTFAPESRRLETRPIKGTRPRGVTPEQDRAHRQELAESLKDRAENLMIVDLMRNDLARVCEVGSVKVDRLFEVETFPTVHHLTSVVSGRLSEGLGLADVMQATFPPGSITGAPKHQAMKVIAAHEAPRGIWCGALFGVGLRAARSLDASVLIRTASFTHENGQWHWRTLAGAGITAGSNPQDELHETAAKISALKQALGGL